MRVLVAGATGVIGQSLVPLLAAMNHPVVGLARTQESAQRLIGQGAEAVIADALDADAVLRAVKDVRPDAIVNMLTAIPSELNPRKLAFQFATTNRLRTEGTRNLVSAADAVGNARIVSSNGPPSQLMVSSFGSVICTALARSMLRTAHSPGRSGQARLRW
ncbi:NAD(P)H-binding protein [Nocardia nova]|uniref:NAD(P)H-binding protein n=1 Tax=Nocardia nova TaxID=37330 RepID=UPI00215731C8|nr:NAD(P)H-binding protein [Nocardia nova]